MIQQDPCICPYPKVSGSITFGFLLGIIASLIPMFYTLITTYGLDLSIIQYIPEAFQHQMGTNFGYFPPSDAFAFMSFIIIGLAIGIGSGSIIKALTSSLIFFIASIVIFCLFTLMFMGEGLDYDILFGIFNINLLIIIAIVVIPACIASAFIQYRVQPVTPKAKKIKLK